ncbi:hypothetical protein YC2023_059581 [Brassica napus]
MSRLKLKSFSQTIIPMETKGNSSIFSDRKTNKKTVASSATARANGKSTASYAIVMKPNGKSAVSSAILMKPNASTALSFAHGDQVMFFRNVSLRPHEADLRFRLIHFWEARNPNTKILIGQEMLLIDEEGTVIQGFVPAGRVGTYKLTPGSVYKLSNFFGSKNKAQYRVTDHSATVTFAWNSDLSALENPLVPIHEDRFKFHSYEEFQANCDRKVDLYGKLILATTPATRFYCDSSIDLIQSFIRRNKPEDTRICQSRQFRKFECFFFLLTRETRDSSSSISPLSSHQISSAMTEQSHSSTDRSRRRRFSEVDYSFGEHYHFRSQVPFISFNDRLQRSRLLFSNTVPTIGGYSRRHHNEEALSGIVIFVSEAL